MQQEFFVCKEGRTTDPDQECAEPSQGYAEPSLEEFGVQVSEALDQDQQLLITHVLASVDQESLLTLEAEHRERPIVRALLSFRNQTDSESVESAG